MEGGRWRQLAQVLRAGSDVERLQASPLGRRLLREFGGACELAAWLDRMLGATALKAPNGRSTACAVRRAAILARYDRGGESRAILQRELGLSERRFYKERVAALRHLSAAIEHRLASAVVRSARDDALARAQARDDAGDVAAALEIYDAIATAGPPAARVRARALRGRVFARAGRGAEARREISLARRLNGALDRSEHREGEAAILLAELQGEARAHTMEGLRGTLDRIRRCTNDAGVDAPPSGDVLTDALLEAAGAYVDAGDAARGEALLNEGCARVARIPVAGDAARARIALLRSLLAASTDRIASAAPLALDAYRAASRCGVTRLANAALIVLAGIACAGGRPDASRQIAAELERLAWLRGDVAARFDAMLNLVVAENALGRFEHAFAWTELARLDAGIDFLGAVEVDVHRVHALRGMRRHAAALAGLDAVVDKLADSAFPQGLGVVLLERGSIVAEKHDVGAARRDIEDCLELLTRYPAPRRLARAYELAFALTSRTAYRDYAHDLRGTLAHAREEFRSTMDAIDYELGFERARPNPCTPRADRAPDSLTARERTVAAYVSAGRSNREIGRALGVSIRTVDQHVEAILRKLDVERRWEIGAQLATARREALVAEAAS